MLHKPPAALLSVVRKPIKHDSAEKQVSGRARYIDDIPEQSGTLHLAPGYAKAARGQILDMDLSAVRAHPGVIAVLTTSDIPGVNDCSPIMGDDPVLADRNIRFYGDVVFCVVAQTRLQARHAAALAKITVEEEKPDISVDDALLSDSPILPDYTFLKGEPETAVEGAPHRTSGTLYIGGQDHFYLESQIALATPQEDGDMHVWSSTQHPSEVQHTVAKVLGQLDHSVVVEVRRMGGGFGGKESQAAQWAALAALGARVTGRPCKLRLDRDDDMVMTGKRHDFRVDYEIGFKDNGLISGLDVTFAGRCGCSVDLSGSICDRTMFHAENTSFIPHARIHSRRLKTNTVSNTAYRGFGGPQGTVFAERMIDEIAVLIGQDPLDVRKANFYRDDGTLTPYGMEVDDNILPELFSAIEVSSDYWARRGEVTAFNATSRFLKKGLALTGVKYGISFTATHLNQAGALVHLYADGSIHLNHGGTEMGQGLNQKVAQVVAEEFGVTLDRVKITATNTGKVPNTAPTAASSGSDLNGMAAKVAAKTIKDRLISFISEKWSVTAEEIKFEDNHVVIGDKALPIGVVAREAFMARISLSSTGFYRTPKVKWDREKGQGRPFYYFAYGACCAEVTIDTLTGEMKLGRTDILHDVGHSLNPALDIGQIEGGFVQGLGWLTTEELVWDDKGQLRTHAPSTYKIPTMSDVPQDLRVALFDGTGNHEETIYRSKAVGEPPFMLANAVFSAIFDAVKSLNPQAVPQLNAPATPEEILRAVELQKASV